MKFIFSVILTAIFSFIGGLFLDWWIISIAAFTVAFLLPQKPFISFLAGFISLFLLWAVLAIIIDVNNESILSRKIAMLFYLGGSSTAIILVTAFIGGVVAAMAALTGSYVAQVRSKKV